MSTQIQIDPRVLETFPGVRVGGFCASQLHQAQLDEARILALWRETAEALEAQQITLQNLADDPRIAAWRSATSAAGLKPSRYKSSPEQLGRRAAKGQPITSPLPVVNAYCAVSARYLAPMGGYDLARMRGGPVVLRHALPEADAFQPLGGRAEDMPLGPQVVVYAERSRILCWNWNHRDSLETCLQATTEQALFLSEALDDAQQASAAEALARLREVLSEGGAEVSEPIWTTSERTAIEIG